jgi:DNA-binding transcriptional LysR family regulator
MKQASYDDISIFVEVARSNGFRAAADKLKLSAGAVSEIVQRIENRLGVRLIERTTRKMSLTDAGERLFERAVPALTNLKSAFEDLSEETDTVSGVLKLSAPRSSAPFFLDEMIAKYCRQYSDVTVEIIYDDSKVDLVTAGIDAAIRSQTLLEKDTYAVEVGPELGMALVASPKYLERRGTPKKPTDLTNHDGVRFAFNSVDRLASWLFLEKEANTYAVEPRSKMVVNDLTSMIGYARAGLGMAYVYRKPVEKFIESGELVALFDCQIPPLPRYTINYLTKRHMPARLRAFIDLAKAF